MQYQYIFHYTSILLVTTNENYTEKYKKNWTKDFRWRVLNRVSNTIYIKVLLFSFDLVKSIEFDIFCSVDTNIRNIIRILAENTKYLLDYDVIKAEIDNLCYIYL